MEEKTPKSWTEFKPTIDEIRKKYGFHEISIGDDQTKRFNNTVLFRGHQDSSWQLETTLGRKTKESFSVQRGLMLATRSVNEIESYMGNKWNIPDFPELVNEIEEKRSEYGPYLTCYNLFSS